MVLSGYILVYSRVAESGEMVLSGYILVYSRVAESGEMGRCFPCLPAVWGFITGPLFQISFLIVLILKNSRVRGDVPIRL